jgi:hypothetical protein
MVECQFRLQFAFETNLVRGSGGKGCQDRQACPTSHYYAL